MTAIPDLTPPRSRWRETGTAVCEPQLLSGVVTADVAIIGGGYTGLSAALRAIERGLKPAVIEASEVGFGASGRNGGVVSTKYRVSLSDMAKHHGLDAAMHMNRLAHDAMDWVERYVADYAIQGAGFAKTGNLRCAHNAKALDRLCDEVRIATQTFGDKSLKVLDRGETQHETGSDAFVGGVLNTHAGVIHPLNYARGLAAAVRDRGGLVFERAIAERINAKPDGVEVLGKLGSVRAGRLIIATNGYSDLTSATSVVRQSVIPFRSAMVATEPLPAEVLQSLLRNGRSYSETRRMMRWFRRIEDRVLFGGRGAFGKNDSAHAFASLEAAMKGIFPQLAGVAITHRWSGLVAMTMDSLPHIGLANDKTAFAVGYNGTGIAMATLLGRCALDIVFGDQIDLGLMRRAGPKPIPLYFMREPAVRTVAGWYQLLDRLGR